MKKAALVSIAAYAPQKILTNAELEKMVETSDEWIVKRTGIHSRHIAEDESLTSMAIRAGKLALERSGLEKNEIDCLICATVTPDFFCMPSTAAQVASELGLGAIMAFDISAACSGFVYLLEVAKSLVESGAKKNVLIIGADKFSSIVDYSDRSICVLFGDGAGAGVVSVAGSDNHIIATHCASDGSKAELLMTPKDGRNVGFVKMSGNEVFKIAVNTLTSDVVELLEKSGIASSEIDLFIPHQANLRIIKAVQERLGLSEAKCVVTVGEYGNTSAASIPMAMNTAYEDGRLKAGSLILLDAFGGGFTWGSALLRFGR